MNISESNSVNDNFLKNVIISMDANGNFNWARAIGTNYYRLEDMQQLVSGEIMSIGWVAIGYGAYMYTVDTDGNAVGCYDVLDSVPELTWVPQDTILSHPVSSTSLTLNNYVTNNVNSSDFTPYTPSLNSTATLTHPPCFGGVGDIQYSPTDGVSPYTFIWSNGTSNQNINGVDQGQYFVRTSDSKGCVRRDTFDLIEPADITFSATVTDVTCYGDQSGAIDVTPSGGTPGYTYSWSNAVTSEDLTGLSGGFYQLTLTDANGCTKQF